MARKHKNKSGVPSWAETKSLIKAMEGEDEEKHKKKPLSVYKQFVEDLHEQGEEEAVAHWTRKIRARGYTYKVAQKKVAKMLERYNG